MCIKLTIDVSSEDELNIIVDEFVDKGFKINKQSYGDVILTKTNYKNSFLSIFIPFIVLSIIGYILFNYYVSIDSTIQIIGAIVLFIVLILINHFYMDFTETVNVHNLNEIPQEVWDIMDTEVE